MINIQFRDRSNIAEVFWFCSNVHTFKYFFQEHSSASSLLKFFKGTSRITKGCLKDAKRMLERIWKDAWRMLKEPFKNASRMLKGCIQYPARILWSYIKDDSEILQGHIKSAFNFLQACIEGLERWSKNIHEVFIKDALKENSAFIMVNELLGPVILLLLFFSPRIQLISLFLSTQTEVGGSTCTP